MQKFLITGLGSIGRRHLAAVHHVVADGELIVLRRSGGVEGTGVPGVRVVHDMADALAQKPDAAIITGPATSHVETAAILAREGVHLLIEKPISDRLDGIDALLAVAHRNAVVLQVGYCLRFDPALAAIKAAIDQGVIGAVLGVQAEVGQYLPDWRPGSDYRQSVSARAELGGGVLLELSHEIDAVRWLAGEIVSVAAVSGRRSDLEIDVEDTADMLLTFAAGGVGNLHLDMVQRVPSRTLKVVGSEGTLVWDGIARQARLYDSEAGAGRLLHGGPDDAARDVLYHAQFRHFLECIASGATPLVTGEDGKKVLEVVLAARQAADTGREVRL